MGKVSKLPSARISFGAITGALVSSAALAFEGVVAALAPGVFFLCVFIFIVSAFINRHQWLSYLHELRARKRLLPFILMGVFGLGFVVTCAWTFWPQADSDAANASVEQPKSPDSQPAIEWAGAPGFGAHLAIRLSDQRDERRRYILSFANDAGATVSLYTSASDLFTMAVKDVRGEHYTLEVPLGSKGVPVAEWIYLSVQLGVSKNSTRMQIKVDGNQIQERLIPVKLKMGDTDWNGDATIGANLDGKENGAFSLARLVIYKHFSSDEDQSAIATAFDEAMGR